MDKLGSFIGWFNANWMQTWPSFRRSRPSLYADRYRERDTTPMAIIECPPTTDMGLLPRSPCDGCTDRLWLQPQKFVSAGSQQHRHFRHFNLVLRGAAALEATQDQVKSCSVHCYLLHSVLYQKAAVYSVSFARTLQKSTTRSALELGVPMMAKPRW